LSGLLLSRSEIAQRIQQRAEVLLVVAPAFDG
jgi:hypothetical protein